MKYYTIYKITHKPSGKFYIGRHKTDNLDDDYMGSGVHITNAIKKYGIENFEKEYLYIFYDEYFMYLLEETIVTEEFCKRNDTYNIAPGGFGGGFQYINQNGFNKTGFIEYNKLKISKINSAKGGKLTGSINMKQAHIDGKIRYDTFKGKTHTEETKNKISLANSKAQSGKNNSQFGTMWITNGIKTKKIKKTDSIPEGYRKGRILVSARR